VGPGAFCCVHVSLVPVLGVVGEQKTKPTQHSVAVLRSLGLNPHLLACRSQDPLSTAVRDKLVCTAWGYYTVYTIYLFISCSLSTKPQIAPGSVCRLQDKA
jgi:hypothetical protein